MKSQKLPALKRQQMFNKLFAIGDRRSYLTEKKVLESLEKLDKIRVSTITYPKPLQTNET